MSLWTKSYGVTMQMKTLCLFSVLFVFQLGHLVEICFWLNLAVKGLNVLSSLFWTNAPAGVSCSFSGSFIWFIALVPEDSLEIFLRENLSKGKTSRTRVLVHGFLCKTREAMKGDLDLTRSCSSYHILSICRVVCIFKR